MCPISRRVIGIKMGGAGDGESYADLNQHLYQMYPLPLKRMWYDNICRAMLVYLFASCFTSLGACQNAIFLYPDFFFGVLVLPREHSVNVDGEPLEGDALTAAYLKHGVFKTKVEDDDIWTDTSTTFAVSSHS